jgi:hypothetical protein
MAMAKAMSPDKTNNGMEIGARYEKLVSHALTSIHANGNAMSTAIPVSFKNSPESRRIMVN